MTRIIRREKRQRTSLGKLILWAFIGFNALMLYWMVAGVFAVSDALPKASSAAEQAGHVIGASIGFTMILMIWAMGAIILGLCVLLTRGDKVIVEEAVGSAPEITDNSSNADEMISRYLQHSGDVPLFVELGGTSVAG